MDKTILILMLISSLILVGCEKSTYGEDSSITKNAVQYDNSNIPTQREFQIYEIYDKALWADTSIPEEVVRRNVALKLDISESELDDIYFKVVGYNIDQGKGKQYIERLSK